MAVSDVIPQDGGQGNVKLHPYLITLVRWCVSCLWSTASVLLHRLGATPLPRLPQITAAKQPPREAGPRGPRGPRAASSGHLHPEARVECSVLHSPAAHAHSLDVIFVHGLYGSLGNTWRQGEWRTKYKLDPTKVPLRNHSNEPCGCTQNQQEPAPEDKRGPYAYDVDTSINQNVTFKQLNGCFKTILPTEDSLITEKFYNNTLLQAEANNYDTRAKFVTELFKNDCDQKFQCGKNGSKCNCNEVNECKCKKAGEGKGCVAGCGCVCDDCYSHCWPRDWIKEDFPGARVISINYTSDPYLWRPLWVKGTKRLRLHERADQMMEQLLALGVGRRPVVWVGHSKGGLFIKQIYCEAYEAHLKMNKNDNKNNNSEDQSDREFNINNNNVNSNNIDKYNRYISNDTAHSRSKEQSDGSCNSLLNNFIKEHNNVTCASGGLGDTTLRSIDDMNEIRNNHNSGNNRVNEDDASDEHLDINYEDCTRSGDALDNEHAKCSESIDVSVGKDGEYRNVGETEETSEVLSSNDEEDRDAMCARAQLWAHSRGFMFYSVPHRGSPLADIKTPLTSRSVELQEIAKDCPLVLGLQSRWLRAAQAARPLVRGLVETGRTLMSVLWLRIVSADSADAGVGVLHGVSVDHREICKPASRRCLLYTELTTLIRGALHTCHCHEHVPGSLPARYVITEDVHC